MKFLKFFLFTAALITVVACGSDDDGGTNVIELNTTNFAGTYEITLLQGSEIVTTLGSDGSSIFLESETFTAGTFDDAMYTFNENGTYTASGAYVSTYVLTVGSQAPVTDTEIESLDGESGTYTLNATSRTISFDMDSSEDVTVFDGNNITVKGSDIDVFEGDTYTYEYEIRLLRVE